MSEINAREAVLRRVGRQAAAFSLVMAFYLMGPLSRTATANPFSCLGEAETIIKEMDIQLMRNLTAKRLQKMDLSAHDHCVIAELMKTTGDPAASAHYEKAIDLAPESAGYELFYGTYLRWHRGPGSPLWHRAKHHYNRGLEKIQKETASGTVQHHHRVTRDWLERGMIALHEADGLMITPSPLKKPRSLDVGYATLNCFSHNITECDEVDGSRILTAETMFSRSRWRANPENFDIKGYQDSLLRAKDFVETMHRLRVRSAATLDLFYGYKKGDNAIVPNYYLPDHFEAVKAEQFGAALFHSFNLGAVDFLPRLTLSYITRQGTIEFFPEVPEKMLTYQGNLDISRFLGPDKLSLSLFGAYMDIASWHYQKDDISLFRYRYMFSAKLDYAFYRPVPFPWGRAFTRGWHWRCGYFADREHWGNHYGEKQDIYIGTELRGLAGWDVTIQPTLMTHTINRTAPGPIENLGAWVQLPTKDATALPQPDKISAKILRTYVTPLYRIIDEEVTPGMPRKRFLGFRPASVNLVFPLRYDVELSGISDDTAWAQKVTNINIFSQKIETEIVPDGFVNSFANYSAGVELWTKWIHTGFSPFTLMLQGGAAYEDFFEMNKKHWVYSTRLYLGMPFW